MAAKFGHLKLVEKILNLTESDSKVFNPNCRDGNGATALHRSRDYPTTRLLLDYGADVNFVDLDGNSPLHLKCAGESSSRPSDLETIECLLNNRANYLLKNKEVFLKNPAVKIYLSYLTQSINF